jgi:RimJ/RimL family protein N-acetyltransferase
MTDMAGSAGVTVRPASAADLLHVRAILIEAIDTSPFYGTQFKAHEKRRLDDLFLRTLIAVDPWHVALSFSGQEIAGVILTVPEFGTLWSPWIYIAPAFRTQGLGLAMIRRMLRHWDNGRFHKIACYVRPENKAARAVFTRFGFAEIAHLRNHMFGEDYLLFERPLNKVTDGYDDGLWLDRGERWRVWLATLPGRFGQAPG